MTESNVSAERLQEMLDGLEGVPAGPWSAHMDDFTLHVERSHFIPENYTLALCATGDHAYKLTPHLARCDPDTMRQIITLALEALALRTPSDGVKPDAPTISQSLGLMTSLVKLQYGNLDADIWQEIQQAEAILSALTPGKE